jgi:sialidase-1
MSIEHIIVHKGIDYHCAFPETIRLQNGDLITTFREAPFASPDPDQYGVGGEDIDIGPQHPQIAHHHRHPESRAALVRSTDGGLTWDPSSRIVIDASDGTQDLNLGTIAQVSSGELVYNNMRLFTGLTEGEAEEMSVQRRFHTPRNQPFGAMVFDSLYLQRSDDNGLTWSEPESFDVSDLSFYSHTGQTGVIELPDGTWLLPFAGQCSLDEPDRVFVARSNNRGRTWGQPSTVAYDPQGQRGFHEPPMLKLSSGKLLIVTRSHNVTREGGADYLYQTFSTDGGRTWQGLERTPIWGYPSHLLQLRDGRILCTYGYRREPYGIRAVFSDDEGRSWDMENEIIIRADGASPDLGYPSSIQLDDGRILTSYYFPDTDSIRYIAGSIWSEDSALN